jgi:hypothetical protein
MYIYIVTPLTIPPRCDAWADERMLTFVGREAYSLIEYPVHPLRNACLNIYQSRCIKEVRKCLKIV